MLSTSNLTDSTGSIRSPNRPPRILQSIRPENGRPLLPALKKEPTAKVYNNIEQHLVESQLMNSPGVDCHTQTEWSWLQDMQLIQRIKREGGSLLNEILEDFQSDSETESEMDICEPIQRAKSASLAEKQKMGAALAPATLDVIGPPKILKFQPETQQVDMTVPSPTMSMESEPIENLGQFMQDFNIFIEGGKQCEFCKNITKAWPTINVQEMKNPEIVTYFFW
jgi:hypothetical protein